MLFMKLSKYIFFTIFLLIFIVPFTRAEGEQLEIVMSFPDTMVSTGADQGYLSVYLDNYTTELFGFQFVIISERPDLVKFNFSGTGYDTTGTLLSGFEYLEAIDVNGDESAYWFRCIADVYWVPGNQDGIFPQTGGVVLKIPFSTTNAPDTTLSLTSSLILGLPTDFSDRYGNSIGVIADTVVDTICYRCDEWIGDSCGLWTALPDTSQGCDMIYLDSSVIGLLDSTIVQVIEGSITLDLLNCDLDGSGDITISDLICLVDHMFAIDDGSICPLLYCDTNVDGNLDIADLVYLVNYMFASGPPPPDL